MVYRLVVVEYEGVENNGEHAFLSTEDLDSILAFVQKKLGPGAFEVKFDLKLGKKPITLIYGFERFSTVYKLKTPPSGKFSLSWYYKHENILTKKRTDRRGHPWYPIVLSSQIVEVLDAEEDLFPTAQTHRIDPYHLTWLIKFHLNRRKLRRGRMQTVFLVTQRLEQKPKLLPRLPAGVFRYLYSYVK